MNLIKDTVKEIAAFKPRKLLIQIVALGATIGSALMFWNILKVLTNVESPIVVVLTESMEPAFYRGDILFVSHRDEHVWPGDIMVFHIEREQIPIVHRAVIVQDEEHKNDPKKYYLLTKGDNNDVDDN